MDDSFVYLLATKDSLNKNLSLNTRSYLQDLGKEWKSECASMSFSSKVDLVLDFAKDGCDMMGWNYDVDSMCWFIGQACIAGSSAGFFQFDEIFIAAYKKHFG